MSNASRIRLPRAIVLCVALLVAPAWARGANEPDERAEAPGQPSVETRARREYVHPARRITSTALALGPGALVHGAGHMGVGEGQVGRKLLAAEGVGLAGFAGGLAGLAVTGASRYTVAPLALMTVAGAGLFLTSWLADVHGTALRTEERGRPRTHAATFESELGHRYVHDPQFRYRHFLVQSIDARFHRLRLSPAVWSALDDRNARYRVALGYRLSGPLPKARAPDGSFLDLDTALTHHAYSSDGFDARSVELAIAGRYDLERWDLALRGSFVEGGAGVALRQTRYDLPGLRIPSDHESLLLARFAFGFYIADPDAWGGETLFYYDHRHDDFAAGLHVTGLGSGVAGHFGALTRFWLGSDFGLAFDAQVGSAYIAGLSGLYRWQEPSPRSPATLRASDSRRRGPR